jgi:hypothetical protein
LPWRRRSVEKRAMGSEVQAADSALLVRPAAFGFHAEAARSNFFARQVTDREVHEHALAEFDGLAERLGQAGVELVVLPDSSEPDAAFPNNWVSFHADGTLVLYPMATEARRRERQPERLSASLQAAGFEVRRVLDLSPNERHGRFLEGTGSLVLDRPNRRAFASLSPRTHAAVVTEFDAALGYDTFLFEAFDRTGAPIYHTNVLLNLGTSFAVLCGEAVAADHRQQLIDRIDATGRTLIDVDFEQLRQFACNLIELRGSGGPVIVMSSAARASFRPDQLRTLEGSGELVDAPIPTIEAVGGGSVRCMIADIHLPRVSRGS